MSKKRTPLSFMNKNIERTLQCISLSCSWTQTKQKTPNINYRYKGDVKIIPPEDGWEHAWNFNENHLMQRKILAMKNKPNVS